MPYKRTTKTSGGVKRTRTINTSTGVHTNSTSVGPKRGQPGLRTTYTQSSDGKSKTTLTTNLGNGWHSKRTINTSPKPKKRTKKQQEFDRKLSWAVIKFFLVAYVIIYLYHTIF
jgi:hypothetical protein